MNNQPDTKTPAISMTDPSGVSWAFDATQGKWSASVEGKKFHSKDYSTVLEKVGAHIVLSKQKELPATSKPTPPAEPVLIEIGLLSIENLSRACGRGHDPINHQLKIEPLIAKVQWDAQKSEVSILRYKHTDQKDSGWKKWGAESIMLVHPNYMTAEMKKVLGNFYEGSVLRKAYENAEKEIAQSWWNEKSENTIKWQLGRDDYESVPNPPYNRHTSNKDGLVSGAWPVHVPAKPDQVDFSDWIQQEDGSLKKGGVVVRMEQNNQSPYSKSMTFRVYLPEQDGAVFSSENLTSALFIGNASNEMTIAKTITPIHTWQSTPDWEKDSKMRGWPVKLEVYAAAIVPQRDALRSSVNAVSFFYGKIAENALGEKSTSSYSHVDRSDVSKIGWHVGSTGYGSASFRGAGPEDKILPHMAQLKKNFSGIADERGLQPITQENLKEIFKSTLSEVYNAVVDGEEVDKDPTAAKKAMDNLMRVIGQKALDRETTQAWLKECTSTVEAIKGVLAKSKPTVAKAPKPR